MNKINAIGFTGTQQGMTINQSLALAMLLDSLRMQGYKEVHHGDCIGADAEFDLLARKMDFSVVIHPPSSASKRAFCDKRGPTTVLPEKPYLDRNRDIVDSSMFMIATPKGNQEELRSGTWATIRYTKKRNVTLEILYP